MKKLMVLVGVFLFLDFNLAVAMEEDLPNDSASKKPVTGAHFVSETEDVISWAKQLMSEEIRGAQRADIIAAIAKVPAAERESIIKTTKIILENPDAKEKEVGIINLLLTIPAGDREDTAFYMKEFFRNHGSYENLMSYFCAIKSIPIDKRKTVIGHIRSLLPDSYSLYDFSQLVKAILAIEGKK